MLNPKQFSDTLQPTAKLIQAGKMAEARQLLRPILEADPKNADGWYLLSLTFDHLEQKSKALERALKLNSQHFLAQKALNELNVVDDLLSSVAPSFTPHPASQFADTPSKNRKLRGVQVAAIAIMLGLIGLFLAVIIGTSPTVFQVTSSSASPTVSPMLGVRGSIVFDMTESLERGHRDIYIMDASHPNPVNLTPDNAQDTSPVLSPDGTQIVFLSDRDGFRDIYIMNPDGGNVRRLTFDIALKASPQWSPDRKHILYEKLIQGFWTLYEMNADGSDDKLLLQAEYQDYSDAVWSPDGMHIAYVAYTGMTIRERNQDIFVMDADGSNSHPLTTGRSDDYAPAWSPDSTRILFTSDAAPPSIQISIYVIDADGQNKTELLGRGSNARWSPEGDRIIFTDFKPEAQVKRDQLFVADADGRNPIVLTDFQADYDSPSWGYVNAGTVTASIPNVPLPYEVVFAAGDGKDRQLFVIDTTCASTSAGCADAAHPLVESDSIVTHDGTQPSWSPDGSKVAFIVPGDKSREVAVLDRVTQQKWVLTDDNLEAQNPVWSPDGTRIAFVVQPLRGDPNIYVMDADGQHITQLTTTDENKAPAWSPDGKQLAYVSTASGIGCDNIFVMDADGSHSRRLTNDCEDNNRPIWSLDGQQILFQARPKNRNSGWLFMFVVINADGSNQHEMSFGTSSYDTVAAWTPDGQYLLLSDISIYLVRPDGSFTQRLIVRRFGDGLIAPVSARMLS